MGHQQGRRHPHQQRRLVWMNGRQQQHERVTAAGSGGGCRGGQHKHVWLKVGLGGVEEQQRCGLLQAELRE